MLRVFAGESGNQQSTGALLFLLKMKPRAAITRGHGLLQSKLHSFLFA